MSAARIPETLAPLAVPVEGLVPYDRNPRRGNVEMIAASLEANGQYRPIVVRKGSNEVLAGNHTLAAAQELGWDQIAVTYVDVSDEDAARIVLADNKAADAGTYDDRELLALLRELESSEAALSGTGYTDDDLDDLKALLSEAEDAEAAERSNEGGGSGDGTDGNAWESTNLQEYAQRYEEQGRRLVVLDYDRAEYAIVTAALDKLRADRGVEANNKAVLLHLSELYPDVAEA
jgi:hypothetical protein